MTAATQADVKNLLTQIQELRRRIAIMETREGGGGGGVSDHGALSGLGDDDHPQYALLAGRAGGQEFDGRGLSVRRATGGMLLDLGPNTLTESGNTFGTGFFRGASGDGAVSLNSIQNLETNALMAAGVVGDSVRRILIQASGAVNWGPGNAARDLSLTRHANGGLYALDSPAQFLFWGRASIGATEVEILPASAIPKRLIFMYAIDQAGTTGAAMLTIERPFAGSNTQDVVIGTGTWRFRIGGSGLFAVARVAGTGTADIAIIGLWL